MNHLERELQRLAKAQGLEIQVSGYGDHEQTNIAAMSYSMDGVFEELEEAPSVYVFGPVDNQTRVFLNFRQLSPEELGIAEINYVGSEDGQSNLPGFMTFYLSQDDWGADKFAFAPTRRALEELAEEKRTEILEIDFTQHYEAIRAEILAAK